MNLKGNKGEIAVKAIWVLLIRVIGYGCGFLFIWLIARQYGARIQGIFSIGFLFLSVGVMLSKLGLETALVKWIASSDSVSGQKFIYIKTLKLVLISAAIVGGVIAAFSPLIALMYDKPDVQMSVVIAGIAVPALAVIDVSSNFFKGKSDTTTFSIYYNFLKFLAPATCLVILIIFGFGQDYIPMASYLIGLSLVGLAVLFHILRKLKKVETVLDSSFSVKFMLNESYPMLVASSIVLIMGWSDVFILGFFVEESKIGIYSTAIKLATIVSFTYNAIATIATPKIASFYSANNMEKFRETISFSSKIMLLSGLPVFILIFAFPGFFLGIFGEEYLAGEQVLRILLLAQLTNVITGPVGPIFNMTNRQHLLQRFIAISLIVNITASLILVHFYELEGVAIGSGLGMILWNLLGAVYIKRKLNIQTWVNPLKLFTIGRI